MAKTDDIEDDIAATLEGMRESIFTVVVSYILDQPTEAQDTDHLFAKNLGTKVFTYSAAPDAEHAGHAAEEAAAEFCERRYGKEPWAVWTSAIFVGRPTEARVPSFEFQV